MYTLIKESMVYTTIPSVKGQITIPAELREKYNISKETPIVLKDNDNGTITIKIMRMVEDTDIEYRESEEEIGLTFKKGIDPATLIKAIKEIDG